MSDIAVAPSPRVRSRRRIDLAPVVEPTAPALNNIEVLMEQARALALEHIEKAKEANAATAAASKALKDLAALMGEHELPSFEIGFGRDVYDVDTFTDIANEPDVAKLKTLVTEEEFMKLVKTTQGAVKDHGGQVLLNQCLKAVTKEPAFKVRKRKA